MSLLPIPGFGISGLGFGDIARIQENQGEEGIVNDIKAELIKGLVG